MCVYEIDVVRELEVCEQVWCEYESVFKGAQDIWRNKIYIILLRKYTFYVAFILNNYYSMHKFMKSNKK